MSKTEKQRRAKRDHKENDERPQGDEPCGRYFIRFDEACQSHSRRKGLRGTPCAG